MRVWITRLWTEHRWLTLAGLPLALLVILVVVVHAPFVRAPVLAWAVGQLRAAGIRAEVERLDYNLLTLRASLGRTTLAAIDREPPFLTVERLDLDLPWSIVTGRLAVESLAVERPTLTVVRGADGRLNLPESADTDVESEPFNPIEIGRLVVNDLHLGYADRPAGFSIDGRSLRLELARSGPAGTTGRLSLDEGAVIEFGDRQTRISRLDGQLAFDGRALTVHELTVEAPEVELRLDGRADLLGGGSDLAARYEGLVLLDRLAPWIAPGQPLSGPVRIAGTVSGQLDAPLVALTLTGNDLAWGDQQGVGLELQGHVSAAAAEIERVRLTLGAGTIDGRARLGLAADAPSSARLRWSAVDIGSIARSAGVEPRVAARADGQASLQWTGAGLDTATARIDTSLSPGRPPPNAIGIGGRVSASLDSGQWTLALEQVRAGTLDVSGQAGGRLVGGDPMSATLGGRVTATVDDLPGLTAALQAAGLPLPELPLTRGHATVEATLSGTVGAPAAAGRIAAADLAVPDLDAGTLTASFLADTTRLLVESFRAAIGPNTASGRMAIDLATRAVRGDIAADLPRVAPLAAMLPPETRPHGAATLQATIGGTVDNPRVDVTAAMTTLEVAGQRFEDVDLEARMRDRVVVVDRLRVAQLGGELAVTGRYALDSSRFAATAVGRALVVRPIAAADGPMPLRATLDLDLRGEGTLDDPRGSGTVTVSDLEWDGYAVGTVRAKATLENRVVRVDAAIPSLRASLDAQVGLSTPRRVSATMAVDRLELDSVRRLAGSREATAEDPGDRVALTGAITATATASANLDRLRDGQADLTLSLIDVTVQGAPLRLERPARLRYDAGLIAADDLTLRIGAATVLTADGRLGDPTDASGLTMRVNGAVADFLPFAALAPGFEGVEAGGRVDLSLQATGTLEVPRVTAALSVADVSLATADIPAVTGLRVRAGLQDGLLTVSELGAEWQGATLHGTASVPVTIAGDRLPPAYRSSLPALPDRARAEIRLDRVSAAAAAPFVDAETLARLSADVAATVIIEATALDLESVDADLTLDRAQLTLAGVPLAQDRPTKLSLADGRVDVIEWAWSGGGNSLTVEGGAALAAENPSLQAAVRGSLDLRMLGAVSSDVAAAGRADFDVRAEGPLAAPAVDGTITVRDGEMSVREPRIGLTGLQGTISITPERLRIADLRASANGGTLEVSGDLGVKGFAPTDGSIAIRGRGLALEVPEDLRSEVDVDLTLTVSETAPALTGTVTILRGSYREPLSLATALLSGVQIEAAVPAEPGVLDRLRLSVNVVSEEGVTLDNNYGRLEIASDLKVVGTLAQPALAGRLTLSEGGVVFLAGQTWTLERGTVDFTNATRIEPVLDLALTTRVQRYEVRLSVSGTPDTLEANLSSSDGLSQADAVSLLLTGQPADESTLAQTDIARGQLLLLLSGELLGFAGRAVGLDSAQVSRGLGGAASDFDLIAADTDPSARLTIGKQLGRDVEIVFSQSLRDNNDLTWIAIYRPLRAIELRATTRDNNARAYEFKNELNFGGGREARASAREPAPRVSAVEWTGSPGFDEPTLRDRISLDEGDRFDFYRWQRDRDRLDDFYRDRGFLEARVRPTREAVSGPDGVATVALRYDIVRGPATTLVVEGATLSGSVVDDMREAWARAVFDGFLRADLEELATRALAREGYLRPAVQIAIDAGEAAGTKRVVVRLDPGVRSADRRLDFSGQQALSASDLEAVVEARQLTLTAWLHPAEVEAALAAHYRALGYQSAAVSVGTPVFADATATLPILVDEGPRFTVASVEVTGATARPEAEVRQAFAIDEGTPFVPAELERARREVEIGYLRDGFNDVRVSVSSISDPKRPSAHVRLDVEEGPQQVLADVAVQGADITTPGTVRRALDLELGAPADVSDTYRAQKRLYDTGVFRRADVELEPMGTVQSTGEQPVRAVISLAEVAPYRLRYGVRLTDDTGPLEANREFRPGFVVDLLRRNLFGRAISAGVAGQVEADRRLARAIVSTPQFFGLPVTSSLYLTQSRQDFAPDGFNPFVEDGSEITAEQRFRPRANMAVSYDYRFKRTRAFDPSPPTGEPAFDIEVHVARLTSTFAWDTRDDPFDARRGWLHSSGIEYAGSRLGSDLRFVKYIAQQFYFRPIGDHVILASAVRAGAAQGFGEDLISSERFFAGGGTSVRGFAEDGLGATDFLGDPVGGAGSLLLNQEVRFPLYRWVRGVAFLDAGNVFARARDLRLFDLEVGAGGGLRIATPFGLARIDYGMPLTRRAREPFGRWYFSLGQAF